MNSRNYLIWTSGKDYGVSIDIRQIIGCSYTPGVGNREGGLVFRTKNEGAFMVDLPSTMAGYGGEAIVSIVMQNLALFQNHGSEYMDYVNLSKLIELDPASSLTIRRFSDLFEINASVFDELLESGYGAIVANIAKLDSGELTLFDDAWLLARVRMCSIGFSVCDIVSKETKRSLSASECADIFDF